MARIKFSGLVTEINGSAGGTTFQRNLYGSTVKNKPVMAIPRSKYQNERKIIMQNVAAFWRNLSNAERQTYIDYANTYPYATRLNPDASINGFNLFVKYNTLRRLSGNSIVSSLSLTQYALAVDNQFLEDDGSDIYYAFTFSALATTWLFLVFISPKIQSYTSPKTNKTRYIITGNTFGGGANVIIGPAYEQRMGAELELGSSYYVDTTFLNNLSGQIIELPTQVIEVTA